LVIPNVEAADVELKGPTCRAPGGSPPLAPAPLKESCRRRRGASDDVVISKLMPNPASLRNLRPWRPGQSGNPKGRPTAPRFTERDSMRSLLHLLGSSTRPLSGRRSRYFGPL